MTSCSNASQPNGPIPEHETFKIQSKQVAEERVINVWTPENYKATKDSLPVMYMADGGVKEDFPHVANTLAKLIKENKIKKFVFIVTASVRMRQKCKKFFALTVQICEDKK